jgi:hypothetical protein
MTDKLQRILNQDVNDLQGKDQISDMILSNTIRNGIREGKRRELKRRWMTYSIGAVATAIAAVIFFTLTPMKEPVTNITYTALQTTPLSESIDLEHFREASSYDLGIDDVLNQKLVKQLNLGVEKDGIKVDVAGTFSDGRKAYVLYSVQNNTNHEVMPIVDSLAFGDVKTPSMKAQIINISSSSKVYTKDKGYFVYSTYLVPDASYISQATLSFKIWDTSENIYQNHFKFTIPLEPNQLEDQERIYYPENKLTVDGQKINITKLQFTPLYTYVDIEYDTNNNQQIFKLLDPVLIGEKGKQREKKHFLYSRFEDDNKGTLVFQSNNFDQMDKTSLKVAGISALPKNKMNISIDLKEKKIIETPDKYLQIVEPESSAADWEILLHFKRNHPMAVESFGIWLEESYTDAEGTKHDRLSPETIKQGGHQVSSQTGSVETYNVINFGKEALNYPQPLTIGIKQYWNPIIEAQSVQLISKK